MFLRCAILSSRRRHDESPKDYQSNRRKEVYPIKDEARQLRVLQAPRLAAETAVGAEGPDGTYGREGWTMDTRKQIPQSSSRLAVANGKVDAIALRT